MKLSTDIHLDLLFTCLASDFATVLELALALFFLRLHDVLVASVTTQHVTPFRTFTGAVANTVFSTKDSVFLILFTEAGALL